jgi:hypothetical protein
LMLPGNRRSDRTGDLAAAEHQYFQGNFSISAKLWPVRSLADSFG